MSAGNTKKMQNDIAAVKEQASRIEGALGELTSLCRALADRLDQMEKSTPTVLVTEAAFLKQERWLYDEMERHARNHANQLAKIELLEFEILRLNGATGREARLEFFRNMAPATGALRLYQKANTALMSVLDGILEHLGIDYWFSCGTLIAAHYRSGSIPWDDDIDIYLMRDDIERLRAYLDEVCDDEEAVGYGYQVTVVYDRIASCKQVRFSSRGELPCFIDLSVMDWTCPATPGAEARYRELRNCLVAEIADTPALDYWKEHPFLYAEGSGHCLQVIDDGFEDVDPEIAAAQIEIIEGIFNKWRGIGITEGIISQENSDGVAQSIDQIETNHYIWNAETIFPTQKAPYETYEFRIPADPETVCQGCYPGSPYLPEDIVGHDHFSRKLLEDPQIIRVLEEFVETHK